MLELNYQHLYYFWVVVREGTVTAASRRVHRSQPTLTAQIRALEEQLGEPLFERQGRRLVPTTTGETVYRYADEIFSLGAELVDAVRGRTGDVRQRLHVGVSDVLPKLIAHRLLTPALRMEFPVSLVCTEGPPRELLGRLAVHELDLVLTDAPIGADVHVRAYNHPLGECGVTVFGTRDLVDAFGAGFPASLDGAPFLLPVDGSMLRRGLQRWFDTHNLAVDVVGEFADSALMKTFAQQGVGLMAGPSVIESEICGQYGVGVVGRTGEVRERFYAISVERKVTHPAVLAVTERAREELFAAS
ncbi:MAG TPA: transcriptional activator NhaR [Candidatus Krumholzibacteria bacterium]|nr:transcriptional activator NhaR [Candidatus Krumholzibacteria bacterium]